MDAPRQPMSLRQQADFIDHLADRCLMADGSTAAETYMRIDAGEAEDLRRLGQRLRRMALHEAAIKELVRKAGK